MKQKVDIHERPLGNPYRVPQGYFSDLNHRILDRATQAQQEPATGWRRYFRLAGFSVGFAAMVVLFSWGFQFITDSVGEPGYTIEQQQSMLLSMYDISSYDIIAIEEEMLTQDDTPEAASALTETEAAYLDEVDYQLLEEELYY